MRMVGVHLCGRVARSTGLVILASACLLLAGCPQPNYFVIADRDENAVIRIDHMGNIEAFGHIVEEAEYESDELSEHPEIEEFLVVNADETVVARVDSESRTLYLLGTLQHDPDLAESAVSEFLIKDAEGVVQALIDEDGNLKYRGRIRMLSEHSAPSNIYNPCGTVEITVTLYYPVPAAITALGIEEQLPDGWQYVELLDASSPPTVEPEAGDELLEFAWIDVPEFPVTITYAAWVPANAQGDQRIEGCGVFRTDGPELRSVGSSITLEQGDPVEGECGEGEGEGEGLDAGEGESALLGGLLDFGEGEGGGCIDQWHTADQDHNSQINLGELLRIIQFFNSGGFHCADNPGDTEDGYIPGSGANHSCCAHDSDYNGGQDWQILLTELLRLIQLYNVAGYAYCPVNELCLCETPTEDGFVPVADTTPTPWDIRVPVELDDYMRCVRENVVFEAQESGAPINAVLTELVEDNGDVFKPRTLVFGLLMLFEMYDEAVFTVPGESSAFTGEEVLNHKSGEEDPLWQDRLIAGVQALQLPCIGDPPPIQKGRFWSETGSDEPDNYPEFYEAVRHLLAIYVRHSCRLTPENLEILREVFACASYPIEDWLTVFKAADEAGEHQAQFQAIRLDEMIYCNRYLGHLLTAVALGEIMTQSETDRYADMAADGAALFATFVDDRLASHGINEFLSPNYHGVLLDKLSLMYALIRDPATHARIKALLDYVWYDVAANWWESGAITGLTRECATGSEPFGMGALLGAHGRAPMFPTGRGSLMDVLRAFGWYTAAEGDSPPYLGFTFASFVSSYRPPDLSAFRVPMDAGESREVWEATGTSGYEQTYNYITGRFALATAQHEYQDPHDMTLTSYLLPSPPQGDIYEPLPGYIIMDAWEDPYGLLKTKKNLGKSSYHVPAFVMSDQDKNQALYLTVSQVYRDDNVLPSVPAVPERFRGYESNRSFLEGLLNRAYGDFYQCDAGGENCSTNTYGNPEWSRTDYLATHFIFPWIMKRTEVVNKPGEYTFGDLEWEPLLVEALTEDDEGNLVSMEADSEDTKYMNFMESLPVLETPTYFILGDTEIETYVAARIAGASGMGGEPVTRVEFAREPVLPRVEIEGAMLNGTNQFTIRPAEPPEAAGYDPTSSGGYVVGDGNTYTGNDDNAPHGAMHMWLRPLLRGHDFQLQARVRLPENTGSLYFRVNDQNVGGWSPGSTTGITLDGDSWPEASIWKWESPDKNINDLWVWHKFPNVVQFPLPNNATTYKVYQNAPGIQIDSLKVQYAGADERFVFPVHGSDNVHRMRLSVLHHAARGQYREIVDGETWAAFFVMMGTNDPDADGTPYYYSSFSQFRQAFRSVTLDWDITTDANGPLLTVEADALEVAAYLNPLARPAPEPAQPDPLLLIRNNGTGNFVPPWELLDNPNPFE